MTSHEPRDALRASAESTEKRNGGFGLRGGFFTSAEIDDRQTGHGGMSTCRGTWIGDGLSTILSTALAVWQVLPSPSPPGSRK
jgi:hypothetical protein